MFWDATYILVLLGALLCAAASANIRSTYNRFGQVASARGYTAAAVAEMILRGADIYDVPQSERREKIDSLAKRFDMTDALSSRIMSYSHGMRQKIMVMGALLHNPSVWILDEPLTGLDPNSAYELKEMMREHAAAGNSVLFSTHVLETAEKLCDQIAIINHGRIIYTGTLDELKTRYPEETSLESIFLEMTQYE